MFRYRGVFFMGRSLQPRQLASIVLFVLLALLTADPVQAVPSMQEQPTATVQFSLVNLYSRPSQSAAITGIVPRGHQCQVEGRNVLATWLLVHCTSAWGWIDRRLVSVRGDLAGVPLIATEETELLPSPIATPTPQPTPVPTLSSFRGWQAAYHNNANLQGGPVLVQDVPAISFDWGSGSPGMSVPADYFSARFERTVTLPQGYYRFFATADDGVRAWLDNDLLIDEWHGATGREYTANRWLAGTYLLRAEFLELIGTASVRFDYDYSVAVPQWQADYYSGAPTRGSLLHSQREPAGPLQLDRTWGSSSPVPGRIPPDFWNGRWSGQFQFESGNYVFRARAQDGVRVYLDGTLVIDAWYDGFTDRSNRFMGVGAGAHTVTVDYYDRTPSAFLQVWWYRDTSGPGFTP